MVRVEPSEVAIESVRDRRETQIVRTMTAALPLVERHRIDASLKPELPARPAKFLTPGTDVAADDLLDLPSSLHLQSAQSILRISRLCK